MIRPLSIVNFERCYLGAIVLGLVNTAIGWRNQMEVATIQASQSGMPAGSIETIALGTVVVGVVIGLLLWFFAARRRAVVAKWIIVVLFALSVIGLLLSIAQGTLPSGISGVLSIAVLVLNAVAVSLLFKPDARRWFGEVPGDSDETLADRFS